MLCTFHVHWKSPSFVIDRERESGMLSLFKLKIEGPIVLGQSFARFLPALKISFLGIQTVQSAQILR